MEKTPYIIRGGIEGRERLRILSRIMQPTTLALLNRVGVRRGMACLDVGCGGGDLVFDLAEIVGPTGRVVGTDFDQVKVEIARSEAQARHLNNVEFRFADINRDQPAQEFDFVHARFVLTHLPNPDAALANMFHALRPGGIVAIEDIDFRGCFSYPESPAVSRYVELYTQTVRRRGGDANIGPRLPALLMATPFGDVQMNIVQPTGTTGEVKLLPPLTMEAIADAVLAEGLASQTEIDQLVAELYEFARSPNTVGGTPRVVEAWGYRS
jgi:SAM-dependent methyltransferase